MGGAVSYHQRQVERGRCTRCQRPPVSIAGRLYSMCRDHLQKHRAKQYQPEHRVYRCGLCREEGHTWTGCPRLPDVAPSKEYREYLRQEERAARGVCHRCWGRPLAVWWTGEPKAACEECLAAQRARSTRRRMASLAHRSTKRCSLCRQTGHFRPTCPEAKR